MKTTGIMRRIYDKIMERVGKNTERLSILVFGPFGSLCRFFCRLSIFSFSVPFRFLCRLSFFFVPFSVSSRLLIFLCRSLCSPFSVPFRSPCSLLADSQFFSLGPFRCLLSVLFGPFADFHFFSVPFSVFFRSILGFFPDG